MNCWKCRKPLSVEKIHFRTECPFCFASQHACINCKNYAPGKPNDCMIPGTEYVRDREAMNFCDDYSVKQETNFPKPNHKNKFNSLFKDEDS
jgi:hypothetical protein